MTITLAKSYVGQRTQLAPQTSSGTGVAATKRLPTLELLSEPSTQADQYRAQGNKFTSVLVPNQEWSVFKGQGAASYGELPVILASVFATATPSGSGPYTWTFAPTDGAPDTPMLYTFEQGDANDGIQTIDNVFTDFGLEFDRKAVKLTAGGIGKAITTPFTLTSQAAVWTAVIGGSPTGGTFTLTFGADTTSGLAYNATTAAVQAALEALASIGTGNVSVTGTAGNYTISLQNALNGTASALTGDGSSLTPSGTVTPTQTGAGVAFYENHPIQPGTVNIYLDTTFAGIGGTQLTNVLSGKFDLTGRWGPEWVVDSTAGSYYQLVEMPPKASLSLLLEANSNAMGNFAHYRAGDLLYLQLKATGPLISGGVHYSFTLNVPVQFSKLQAYKDDGGVYAIGLELEPISDPTAGYPMQAIVVNSTAAL